jgi:isoaspartyl peptidase/L-asparaginase-like protein (Ntn-hydrolase superfamily)
MGFTETSLATQVSEQIHKEWLENKCQPNFWKNVTPDPASNCGPYSPASNASSSQSTNAAVSEKHHDTIGMIAIDSDGRIAAGTSTNGAQFKIPGRVGDTAIPGSGAFVDPDVGAAAATGDGDVMMRFLPSMVAVEQMRLGSTPYVAGVEALSRIARVYPDVKAAMVVAKRNGEFAGVCYGFEEFKYSVVHPGAETAQIVPVSCFSLETDVLQQK